MSSTICKICKIVILLFVYAPLSEGIDIVKPSLYPPAACTLDSIIELIHGVTIPVCLKECERRYLCQSINFNRFIAVCVLRREVDIPLSATEPMRCVNIAIEDIHETLTDSCSSRPCDNSSLCIPSEDGSAYSCKLVYCISQPYIQNAELRSHAPTHIGGTNAYVCRDGFTEFGHAKVECKTDGNWTETEFVCYPNCPTIPLKVGGRIMSRSTHRLTINTTVIYSCSTGYYNLSSPKITCNETGDWSDFECTPHCRQSYIPKVNNGNPTAGDYYTINMTAEYSCNDGYYLSPGSPIVHCERHGHWSPPEIVCTPHCRQSYITEVINGYPTAGDYYTISMTAEYSCNDGYYLSPGSPIVHCDRHGNWSTPEIVCYKHCLLPSLDNAVINTIPDVPFVKGSKVTFGCVSNYYAFPFGSEAYVVCTQTGVWESEYECYKYCDSPPDNWYVTIRSVEPYPYTVESTATYRCIVGTTDQRKKCQKNGKWTGQVKCCGFWCSTL